MDTDIKQIYEEHFGDVYKYVFSLTKNKELAEDVTADTFMKAIKNIGSFRGECELKVWLFGIAKNTYRSMLRKDKNLSDEEIPEAAPDLSEGVQTKVEKRLTSAELHKILHTLEEPYKEVFTLRVFGELSFREIGELFEKSEHWACVTFHRAKEKIQEKYEKAYTQKK